MTVNSKTLVNNGSNWCELCVTGVYIVSIVLCDCVLFYCCTIHLYIGAQMFHSILLFTIRTQVNVRSTAAANCHIHNLHLHALYEPSMQQMNGYETTWKDYWLSSFDSLKMTLLIFKSRVVLTWYRAYFMKISVWVCAGNWFKSKDLFIDKNRNC